MLSVLARHRTLPGGMAGLPGVAARYLLIVIAHVAAVGWLVASTRSPMPLSESTLAVDWQIALPAAATPAPAQIPPPPQPRTAPRSPALTPVAAATEAAPPVSAPVLTPIVAAPIQTPSPAPAVAPDPRPVAAIVPPRYDADYLHNPTPVYPPLSRRLGEEGKVVLRVEVGADGRARQIEIVRSTGSPRLDNAALDAVHQWRFQPARQGETPLGGWVQVPINFRLSQ